MGVQYQWWRCDAVGEQGRRQVGERCTPVGRSVPLAPAATAAGRRQWTVAIAPQNQSQRSEPIVVSASSKHTIVVVVVIVATASHQTSEVRRCVKAKNSCTEGTFIISIIFVCATRATDATHCPLTSGRSAAAEWRPEKQILPPSPIWKANPCVASTRPASGPWKGSSRCRTLGMEARHTRSRHCAPLGVAVSWHAEP